MGRGEAPEVVVIPPPTADLKHALERIRIRIRNCSHRVHLHGGLEKATGRYYLDARAYFESPTLKADLERIVNEEAGDLRGQIELEIVIRRKP
jgi:hypothetical protein